MLLFIEIMMTVAAYRRGYKGLALLPLGFAILAGAFISMNNPEIDILNYVWIDILAIVILGVMIFAGKSEEEKSESLSTYGKVEELPEYQ